MATPPDFSPGQVLTAAHMDAVGLWLVKTQIIGSAVSSVTVTDAFSADYDNYLILVNGGASSTTTDLQLKLGSTTTGYYNFLAYTAYNVSVQSYFAQQNVAAWNYCGAATTTSMNANINLHGPFLSDETHMTCRQTFASTTTGYYHAGGFLNNTTSYTAFTLTPASGTITGGTIRVYGYRN